MGKRSPYHTELKRYQTGLGFAVLLTLTATALVWWPLLSPTRVLGAVFALGLAQLIVHFHYFLQIGLGRDSRSRLNLLLFSALIISLMIAGSLIVFFDQLGRM